LHQVSLSQSDRTIEKQRIVNLSRFGRNRFGSRKSDIIGSSDDERIKGEFRIEKDTEKFGQFVFEDFFF